MSFLGERRLIGQLPFQNHAHLKKQALAASACRGVFHYSETPGIPAICAWRDIKFL
jgi:hypothetical protein